jgi:hypothetical protein
MGPKERPVMSLKFKFKTKDEIPADHLPLYAERDDVWMLDVKGRWINRNTSHYEVLSSGWSGSGGV